MNILDSIDKWLLRGRYVELVRDKVALYPSECGIKIGDKKVGSCLRAMYYSRKNIPESDPTDAGGYWTMSLGKQVEVMVLNWLSDMGVLVSRNAKFNIQQYNISGEVDGICWNFEWKDKYPIIVEPRTFVGIEIKSAYGYKFYTSINTYPTLEHLLQVLCYMKCNPQLPLFKLIYVARDNPRENKKEYTIGITEKEEIVVDGKINYTINWQGIEIEWKKFEDYWKKQELPPRDYTWNYNKRQVLEMFEAGIITKNKYKAYLRGEELVSDWECLYCSYLNYCYPERVEEETYAEQKEKQLIAKKEVKK